MSTGSFTARILRPWIREKQQPYANLFCSLAIWINTIEIIAFLIPENQMSTLVYIQTHNHKWLCWEEEGVFSTETVQRKCILTKQAETMSLIEAGEPLAQWQEFSLYLRIVSCGVRTGHCRFAFSFHAFMQNLNCLPLKLRSNKCIPGGKSYFVRNLKLKRPRNSSSNLCEIPEMPLVTTGMPSTIQFRRQLWHFYSSYTFWVPVMILKRFRDHISSPSCWLEDSK